METVSAESNWRLTLRRSEAGVTILSAQTCDERAVLPAQVLGLPVTELAHHALAAGRPAPQGEEVTLRCGGGSGEWNNARLRELTLPETLHRVGDYAFLNCGALKCLRLSDTVTAWGGGCFMNCRELDTFVLRRGAGEPGESLAYIADELSRELDVTAEQPDGTVARLIFPEYVELYEENCPAHHFDYNILGAGYPYHHCFRRKRLQLLDYDLLWQGFLAVEHDPRTAARMAYYRLRWPAGLTEEHAAAYRDYLSAHGGALLRWLVQEGDQAGAAFLLRTVKLSDEALSDACGLARNLGRTETVALLLEEQHKRAPAGKGRRFEL